MADKAADPHNIEFAYILSLYVSSSSENGDIFITLANDWRRLTLITEAKGMLKSFTISNATALLLNQPSYHRSVEQQTWLRDQYQAMGLEADYVVQKLSKFKNVRADCVRFMNFILVKIRFPSDGNAEYIEDSLITTNLALRYRIEGPPDSVLSKKEVDKYVTRTGKVTNFTGAIVDFDMTCMQTV